MRDVLLTRMALDLSGIVAVGAGQALDWFGASTIRWTPLLAAAVLLAGLAALPGSRPRWRRAMAWPLLLVAMAPLTILVPSVQVSTAVVAAVMTLVGVLQRRR